MILCYSSSFVNFLENLLVQFSYSQPCGEIQIIQEDSPLRTPRDVVGRLAPLRNFHSASAFQAKLHGHENEGDNSDALSEDSFTSELSLTERRLHESALASSSCGSDLNDDSTSGENANLEIGNKVISDRQTCRGVGWRKDSVSRFREVPRASWPAWVYRMYDSYCLAQQVAGNLTQRFSIFPFIFVSLYFPSSRGMAAQLL